MYGYDDELPEHVREIAARLVEARAVLSPVEFDELRGRIRRRLERAPRRSAVSGLRHNWIAGVAAIGLMLTSGAGAVIASTSLAGSRGHGDSLGSNFERTFSDTSVHHMRDASSCAFSGPFADTIRDGSLAITLVWDCRALHVDIRVEGNGSVRTHGSFSVRFADGSVHSGKGFWDGFAPTGSTGMIVSAGGVMYTVPFSS